MIRTTRLNDSEIVVNADLIEVIEATPDTVITLIDGTRFVVRESPDVLIERIQQYRAALLSMRDDPVIHTEPSTVPLALVDNPHSSDSSDDPDSPDEPDVPDDSVDGAGSVGGV